MPAPRRSGVLNTPIIYKDTRCAGNTHSAARVERVPATRGTATLLAWVVGEPEDQQRRGGRGGRLLLDRHQQSQACPRGPRCFPLGAQWHRLLRAVAIRAAIPFPESDRAGVARADESFGDGRVVRRWLVAPLLCNESDRRDRAGDPVRCAAPFRPKQKRAVPSLKGSFHASALRQRWPTACPCLEGMGGGAFEMLVLLKEAVSVLAVGAGSYVRDDAPSDPAGSSSGGSAFGPSG